VHVEFQDTQDHRHYSWDIRQPICDFLFDGLVLGRITYRFRDIFAYVESRHLRRVMTADPCRRNAHQYERNI